MLKNGFIEKKSELPCPVIVSNLQGWLLSSWSDSVSPMQVAKQYFTKIS